MHCTHLDCAKYKHADHRWAPSRQYHEDDPRKKNSYVWQTARATNYRYVLVSHVQNAAQILYAVSFLFEGYGWSVGALVMVLEWILLLGTLSSAVVQKLPLTAHSNSYTYSGTRVSPSARVGKAGQCASSTKRTTEISKLAASKKNVLYVQDVLCNVMKCIT